MTARATRPARRKKPSALTAHAGYQPTRRVRDKDRYHAVADQAVTLGQLARDPGQALCGQRGPWPDPPLGLFGPLVTCPACRALAAEHHITIAGEGS